MASLPRRYPRAIWLIVVIVVAFALLVLVSPVAARQPGMESLPGPEIRSPHHLDTLLPTDSPSQVPDYFRYLAASEPTDGNTATPEPSFHPVPDNAEPNWDFDHAYRFLAGDELFGLNFNPTETGAVDNDFFVFAALPGRTYTCETRNLVGVDTNLIVYGPTQSLIGGSDDVDLRAGLVNSRLSFTPNYEDDTFVLVGYKQLPVDLATASYSLTCYVEDSPTASTSSAPDTNHVCTAHATPVPIPFSFTLLSEPTRQPTPTLTPVTVTRIQIIIGYDENANGVLDLPEGVSDLSVRVVDTLTNRQLAHGFTDIQGTLSFIVVTDNEVRVLVPFLSAAREFRPGPPVTWELLIPPGNQPGLIP